MLKLDIFLKMYTVPVILSFYLFLYCLKNQSIISTLVSISKLIVDTPSNYLVSLIEPSRVSSSGQTFLEYSQQLSNYLHVWSQRTLMYLYISCPNIFYQLETFFPTNILFQGKKVSYFCPYPSLQFRDTAYKIESCFSNWLGKVTCRIFINSRYSGPVPRCFHSVVDRVTGQSDALSEFRNTV